MYTYIARFERAVESEAQMKSELLQMLFAEVKDSNNLALCDQFLRPISDNAAAKGNMKDLFKDTSEFPEVKPHLPSYFFLFKKKLFLESFE